CACDALTWGGETTYTGNARRLNGTHAQSTDAIRTPHPASYRTCRIGVRIPTGPYPRAIQPAAGARFGGPVADHRRVAAGRVDIRPRAALSGAGSPTYRGSSGS